MRAYRRERHAFRPVLDYLPPRIAPCCVVAPTDTSSTTYFAPIDDTTALVTAPNLTGTPTTTTDPVLQ